MSKGFQQFSTTFICCLLFLSKAFCQCPVRDHFWCPWTEAQQFRVDGDLCYHPEGFAFSIYKERDFPGGHFNGLIPLYRFYSPTTQFHFYSPSKEEGLNAGYTLEGIFGYVGENAETPNCIPIYRFYNPTTGNHFYTPDKGGEISTQDGYVFEGICFYAWGLNHGTMRIVRMFSPFPVKTKKTGQDDITWANLNNFYNPPPSPQRPPTPSDPTPPTSQCLGNGIVNFYNTNSQPLFFYYWYAEEVANGSDECRIRRFWKQLSIGNNQFPIESKKTLVYRICTKNECLNNYVRQYGSAYSCQYNFGTITVN